MAKKEYLEFLGHKWRKADEGAYRYERWELFIWSDAEGYSTGLNYDNGPKYQLQIELAGFGKTVKAALADLERQMGRVSKLLGAWVLAPAKGGPKRRSRS